jgi:hypothetical protein
MNKSYVTSTPSWLLSSSTTRQMDRAHMKHSETTTTDAENGVWRWGPFPWTLLLQSNHINLTINHSLSYLQPTRMKIGELTFILSVFTTLSAISDSWQQLLLRAPFLQLYDTDITSRLILDYLQPIWMKSDDLSSIQCKNGCHLGKLLIARSVLSTIQAKTCYLLS